MQWMNEENLSEECTAEVIALEEKWGLKLCTKAVLDSQRPILTDTRDTNRRLAQLERCIWGRTCGPSE